MITVYKDQLLLGGHSIPTTYDPHLYNRVREAYALSINKCVKSPTFGLIMDELVSLFTQDLFYDTRQEVAKSMGRPLDDFVVRSVAMEACEMASKNFCEGVEEVIEEILMYEKVCFSKDDIIENSPQNFISFGQGGENYYEHND